MKNKKSSEELLKKILLIVRKNPGIRASAISRKLNREHTWSYRKTLIKRGLVMKEKDGAAVRYYPVK